MNEKKQIFLIGGLLVILVVIWVLVLNPPKKSQEKTAMRGGLEFKVIVEMMEKYSNNKEAVMEFSYEKDRDPFSLVKNVSEGGAITFRGLILKGILWDPQKPLAIINEEVIGEGGMIKGVEIKKIEPDHVVLEAGGEEKVVFIEGVKKENFKNIKMEDETDEKIAPIGIY